MGAGGAAAVGFGGRSAAIDLHGRGAAPGGGFGGPDDRAVQAVGDLVGEQHLRVGDPGRGQALEVLMNRAALTSGYLGGHGAVGLPISQW